MTGLANVDLPLERRYVGTLITGAPPGHLETGNRLDPADLSDRNLSRVLAAAFDTFDADTDVNEITLRGAIPGDLLYELAQEPPLLGPMLHSARRRLSHLAQRRRTRETLLRAAAANDNGDPAWPRILEAVEPTASAAVTFSTTAQAAHHAYAEYVLAPERGTGPRWRLGFPDLDRHVGRLNAGDLCIVGGDTNSGKSWLLLEVAHRMQESGCRPGILSVEDDAAVYGMRSLSRHADVSAARIHRGELTTDEIDKLTRSIASPTTPIPLAVARYQPLDAVMHALRALRQRGCDVLIVDYLQAIALDRSSPRLDKVFGDAAARLKAIAGRLGVPLLLASQLGRRPGGPPTLHHLKESGDLENMAEVVLLLWRESDARNADTLLKVGKLKSGIAGATFRLERSPTSGAIADLASRRSSAVDERGAA